MKEKIGIIAIGQAGGNIGYLLEQKGLKTIYLNTSRGDLDTINTDNSRKYHINEGLGCAKDREKSKELVKNDFNNILSFIKSHFQTQTHLFLVFSAGGGTGGGSSPALINIASSFFKDKKIGAITILPSEKDTLQAQINAYECMQELNSIENMGSSFILDNNQNTNISFINEKFVSLFNKIFEYKKFESKKGNIDEAEILKLLETKGAINIASIKNDKSTKDLIANIKGGIFAPIENDGKVKYLGLSNGIKIDYDLFYKEIGKFIDKFENSNSSYTMAILSGLTLPFTRVLAIKNKIENEKELIERNFVETENKLESLNLNIKKDIKKETNVEDEEINVDDLLKGFGIFQ